MDEWLAVGGEHFYLLSSDVFLWTAMFSVVFVGHLLLVISKPLSLSLKQHNQKVGHGAFRLKRILVFLFLFRCSVFPVSLTYLSNGLLQTS